MMSSWRMVLLAYVTSLLLMRQATAQDATCNVGCDGACCTNFVMDNPLREVVDFNTTLGRGVYYGVFLKLCTEQPFSLGLWSQDPGRADLLVLEYTLDFPGTNNRWKQVMHNDEMYYATNFSRPWNVSRGPLYLGVMAMMGVIPIPYKSAPASQAASKRPPYRNVWLGNLYSGDVGRRVPRSSSVVVEHYPWARSFSDFVSFCAAPGCLDEAQQISRGPRGYPGPPGLKGPPGPPGPTQPGFGAGFGCDNPDSDLSNKLNSIASQTERIISSISKVETDVNKLNRGERETGKCPRNYVSGSYGLGDCYYFWSRQSKSFGEAALGCVSTERSHLLDIESEAEDQFIAETVVPKMREGETNLTFFTSGLYSPRYQTWVWYSDQVLKRMPLVHSNWAPGEELGFKLKQTCLAVRVFRDKTTQWISTPCTAKHGFICKRAKKCY